MCGFLGAFSFNASIPVLLPALQAGLHNIRHRGPDATSFYNDDKVYLGHNRLSIIDLSEAATQPLVSANSNARIIFNGEIYNFSELKQGLQNKGVQFSTNSDTEVILEGYLLEGNDFFKNLRGIYAFAIHDGRNDEKLIICRDPSGIKPLYFYRDNDLLVFGSEIKSLLPVVKDKLTINEEIIKIYLNLNYCPEPYTVYNEVSAVVPGTCITVCEDGLKKYKFFDFDFNSENALTYLQNVEQSEKLLEKAVHRNLVADVEVAVALSGGIDSSLVYAYASKSNHQIKGLTVSFADKKYDEAELATSFAKQVSGNQVLIEVENDFNLELLKKLFIHFDQPYADSSAIPVYFLTRSTKKYSKVLLGGDGGDELFNGYPSQTRLVYLNNFIRYYPVRKLAGLVLGMAISVAPSGKKRGLKRIKGLVSGNSSTLIYDWKSWIPRSTTYNGKSPFLYDPDEGLMHYESLFKETLPDSFSHTVTYDYYYKTLLSDYLRKTDMMSMYNAVEYRVPLLDEDLVSFALQVPYSQKSTLKVTKKLLRDIHSKIYTKEGSYAPKKGFTIPLDVYLTEEDLRSMKKEILQENGIVLKYITREYIEFLFEAIKGKRDSPEISRTGVFQRILMFYSLHLWFENFQKEKNRTTH